MRHTHPFQARFRFAAEREKRPTHFFDVGLAVAAFGTSLAATAFATVATTSSLTELTASASVVMRGLCAARHVEAVHVAGATVQVTVYTFEVRELLDGAAAPIVQFRQVGSPHGGAADLGRLVGLPVYETGHEYVLFLLPQSKLGLTSPAGAGAGAFAVHAEQVTPLGPHAVLPSESTSMLNSATSGVASMPYSAFRDAILGSLQR